MNRMIPVTALLLCVLLLFAGCTGTPSASVSPDVTDTAVDPTSQAPDAPTTAASDDTSEPDPTTAPTAGLTRGVWEDNVYTSDFANLKFEMPAEWNYASDEEMATLFNFSADQLAEAGMAFSKEMIEARSVYDMMAQSATTGSSVAVVYENLNFVIGGSSMEIGAILDKMQSDLTDTGMGYTFDAHSQGSIGSESYDVLNAKIDEYNMSQKYYLRRVGSHLLTVIVTAGPNDNMDDLLATLSSI